MTCRFAGDPRGDSGFLVSDFDLDELRTLDAGSWFLEPDGGPRTASGFGTLACLKVEAHERFASGSIRVPTLVEALRLTDRLNWMVNVELKSFPNTNPSLLDAVLVTIDATETAARVLISSFDHGDVARGPASARDRHRRPHRHAACLPPGIRPRAGRCRFLPPLDGRPWRRIRRLPSPPLTPGAADQRPDRAEGRGIPVLAYTVNDARRDGLAAHLAEAGIGGLFSDDPGRLRTLFDR